MKKSIGPVFLSFCILLALVASGCVPAPTQVSPASPQEATSQPVDSSPTNPNPEQPLSARQYTIPEAEKLAGFDFKEPAYLPSGVSFEYATYEESPSPAVVLHFKIIHEQLGDMGAFFQIMQQPDTEAPIDTTSCGDSIQGCEVLQINTMPVVYTLNTGGTEGLNWHANGISFRLLRTAGEPNKVYRDELVKVVESMK